MSDQAVDAIERWPHVAIRLLRTPSGWIHVHLATTETGWLTRFDNQGRYVALEQVWWEIAGQSQLVETSLEEGFVALGLPVEEAREVAASLSAEAKPLSTGSHESRWWDAFGFLMFFPLILGGWVLALALLAWIVLTAIF